MPTPLKAYEITEGFEGDVTVGSTVSGQQQTIWRVEFDAAHNNAVLAWSADAGANGKVPDFRDTIGIFILTGKKAKRHEDSPLVWDVTCTYVIPVPGQQESKPDDPDVQRWSVEINITSERREVEAQYDVFMNPIENSAGDPITGIPKTLKDRKIAIAFTTDLVDIAGISTCEDKVNDSDVVFTVNGQPRTYLMGTLLFDDWTEGAVLDGSGIVYPRMTYYLAVRPDGWVRKVADKGLRELIGDGPGKQAITSLDENGNHTKQKITSPAYLDGTGHEAAIGAPVSTIPVNLSGTANLLGTLMWDLNT